jgi:hypothetical protein
LLPAVDDLDRHLGGVELVEADVARDPDRGARPRRVRDQRVVMPVVHAQEPAHVARAQHRLGGEEALEPRAFAQALEHEHEGPAVGRLKLADRDRRHVRSDR